MTQRPTVALVNNESVLLDTMQLFFAAAGLHTRAFLNTGQALDQLSATPADLLITDYRNHPFYGDELVRRLRQSVDMPVIFYSAHADWLSDTCHAALLADDYLEVGCSMSVLVARAKAILKRSVKPPPLFTYQSIILDLDRHTSTCRGQPIYLNVPELFVLAHLIHHAGRLVDACELMAAVYGRAVECDEQVVAMHVRRLTWKLQRILPAFCDIECVFGIAYRLPARHRA